VTISVSDGEATTSSSFLLTVEPVNDPPVITSPGTATATEDEAFVYQASAVDIDGPGLSLQFQNYPGWLSPSGPEISGTPPNGSQSTVFRLIASDGILTDTLDVHLTVVPVNDPPCFDYPLPELVFDDTDTLNWQIDLDEYASDPDDPDSTLAWSYSSIEHASITITIDSVSHVVTFSGVNYISTNHIVFTVSDPQGAWAADTLTITMLQTSIEEDQAVDLPRVFVLSNNYPNPFNPVTAIQYSVPKFSHVILCIYNIMGQKLETLVDAKKAAGTYEVHWNASDYPSGIYIYRMQADTFQSIKRMVLLK
jgi:hypothetical protein